MSASSPSNFSCSGLWNVGYRIKDLWLSPITRVILKVQMDSLLYVRCGFCIYIVGLIMIGRSDQRTAISFGFISVGPSR